MGATESRRPIAVRTSKAAQLAAAALARRNVSANQISAASVVFALLGGAGTLGMAAGPRWLGVFAALCIVLRLIANMLDGMVAVEHDRAAPTGPVWNELPDRVADALFLVAAGYAAALLTSVGGLSIALGWLAALLAVLTAYVRELGRALSAAADFCGPFAKPQRMWALALGLALTAFEGFWDGQGEVLLTALAVIAGGTLLTLVRRTHRLGKTLQAAASAPPSATGTGG